jgi:broad specificity phosphatase PhoE
VSDTQTILTIVRHGETQANIDSVWHGSTDEPLTGRGEAQARQVAHFLAQTSPEAVALYTSPLRRARSTATTIGQALKLAVRIEPDLAEYSLGVWEGLPFVTLRDDFRLWKRTAADPDFAPPEGESPRQVTRRMLRALRQIVATHASQRAIVVSHGAALSLGFAALFEIDPSQYFFDNCSVSELVFEPAPRLLSYNQTRHLKGLDGEVTFTASDL